MMYVYVIYYIIDKKFKFLHYYKGKFMINKINIWFFNI